MKRRICCLMLAAVLILCTGCARKQEGGADKKEPQGATQTAPEAEPQTEPAIESQTAGEADDLIRFAPVLDAVSDVIYNGFPVESDESEYPLVPLGVIETVRLADGNEALEYLGFTFVDLNGDGVSELLVGEKEDSLFGGFSIVDGKPVAFLEGWARNRYYLMSDGRIYNHGSGGAMNSIFGVYHLNSDGTQLECENCYFTELKEGTEDQIALYHNTTGKLDVTASEQFHGTEEEFWKAVEECGTDFARTELAPFSAYDYTGPINQPLDCKVRLDYWDDVFWKLPEEREDISDYCPELQPSGDEHEVTVVFRSVDGVKDFRLLALVLKDVDESGNATFDVTELCSLPELKADVPLTVPMVFPGDLPTSGFSYREDGVEKQFSISQSGRDGALVVASINGN